MLRLLAFLSLLLGFVPYISYAQSSCTQLAPSAGIRPALASGYQMQVVATGLSDPRGILLDGAGNLLVVEQSRGVVSCHKISEDNGCVSLEDPTDLTQNIGLNHGIEMSPDGGILYASTPSDAYAWDYDLSARSISKQRTIVTNMTGTDHSTRALLLSRTVPGMMVIGRGSFSNIDFEAASIRSGHSQVKAFNLDNRTGAYDYTTDGLRLGWGLRNEVGLGEHPGSGGIWGVENSADQQTRMGVDIHQNNPGEELNFFGYLNGTEYADQGTNFGYPWCFSAWGVEDLPNNDALSVGSQYAIDATSDSNNENRTDAYCAEQTQARLIFQAHMAPLDIKFNDTGRQAWVTFHGSWNRDQPIGYKLSVVNFHETGEPVDLVTSRTAAKDVLWNEDLSQCPENCLRPVGMAIDGQGRIFMSSDASGEIYLISRIATTGNSSPTTSSTSTSSTPASSTNAASYLIPPYSQWSFPLTVGAYLVHLLAALL